MVLFQVVDTFKNAFIAATFKWEKVKTDTAVFRLHYKLSVWLVLIYSISYMYVAFSNPISCMGSKFGTNDGGISGYKKEVNDYCWVHGTYSHTNLDPAREIYPGIGEVTRKDSQIQYQNYYKWMWIYIVLMITLLQIPRQVWRSLENGRLQSLVLKMRCIMLTRNEILGTEKDALVDYLHAHLGNHRLYAMGFVLAEGLNVAISSILMCFWDLITEHELSSHGANIDILKTRAALRADRLAKVFPILGKCTINTFGPGGDIQRRDFICVLPLNVINERAAVFFWYYFMLLLIIGIGALIFRFGLVWSTKLRVHLLCVVTPFTPVEEVKVLVKNCSYSDWFLIYNLGCSLEPVLYREIIQKLVRKFPCV